MDASTQNFQVGQIVTFGRPNGVKTKAIVIKVNRTKVKVRQIQEREGATRTFAEGTIWHVPPRLLTPVAPSSLIGQEEVLRCIRNFGTLG